MKWTEPLTKRNRSKSSPVRVYLGYAHAYTHAAVHPGNGIGRPDLQGSHRASVRQARRRLGLELRGWPVRLSRVARKLKVYRTPIGFHDAYVAVSSQKAALAAWGSDANLFARGMAEEVTDTALTVAPLAHPGDVIRVARGSAADHMAALPASKAKPRTKAPPSEPSSEPPPKLRAPRPSRHALAAAEAAIDDAKAQAEKDDRDLAKREATLAAERKTFDRRTTTALCKLEDDRDAAKADYDRKLKKWEP